MGKLEKSDKLKLVFAGVTGILITASYIVFHNNFPWDFIQIMPLYISLFIMFLQSNVNRVAFLIGGVNAVFYGVVYCILGLYASACYAVLVSCPLQIITFFNWKKHAYGKSARFKRLGTKKLVICLLVMLTAFVICYIIFNALGSKHLVLDNVGMIFGIFVTVLCTLLYVEYIYLTEINQIIYFVLYGVMAFENPLMIPYFIYNIYCTVCVTFASIKIYKLYKEQQMEGKLNEKS